MKTEILQIRLESSILKDMNRLVEKNKAEGRPPQSKSALTREAITKYIERAK